MRMRASWGVLAVVVASCASEGGGGGQPDAGTGGTAGLGGQAGAAGAVADAGQDADAPDDVLGMDAPDSDDADAGPPEPKSCVGLAKSCGAGEDCCASPSVPGGTFNRNNDANYPATVSPFHLDKFEITVGRFRKFVEAGLGTQQSPPAVGTGAHPKISSSGWTASWNQYLPADDTALKSGLSCNPTYPQWATWTDTAGANEALPLACLNWYQVFAFCAWDGGRIPTDVEWNFAAAGGTEQRVYPWSNPPGSTSIDSTLCNYDCMGDGVAGCTLPDILAVGSKPLGDGRWGQSDLGGSLKEWVLDDVGVLPSTCTDCANLAGSQMKVTRGGGFTQTSAAVQTDTGGSGDAKNTDYDLGARCARDL
jgi:sulfatase modifying factor 1